MSNIMNIFMNVKIVVRKPKLTAEDLFMEAWNEFGYPGSDIVREYQFHPLRRWRFDFAFPSRFVAVEIDGRGRHQTVTGVRRDAEKCNTATARGWDVLHIPTSDIRAKNEHAEPLVELFIEQLCEILANREIIRDDKGRIYKRVDGLQEMPPSSRSKAARSV